MIFWEPDCDFESDLRHECDGEEGGDWLFESLIGDRQSARLSGGLARQADQLPSTTLCDMIGIPTGFLDDW